MGNTPTNQVFEFSFSELEVKKADIEFLMGYTPNESPEPICSIIDEVIAQAEFFTNIKGGFVLHPLEQLVPEKHGLIIGKELFEVQKVVYGLLKKSSEIAIFACTAGEKPGEWSKTLMQEGDMMKGYVVDVLGNVTVEAAMDRVQQNLMVEMQDQNKKITNRYSPGYCNWNVSEQHKLFNFIPSGFCGITLTDSALMRPVKSVSGFIGIGSNVRFNKHTCNICDNQNCIYKSRKT
jgi:hypothetical protein